MQQLLSAGYSSSAYRSSVSVFCSVLLSSSPHTHLSRLFKLQLLFAWISHQVPVYACTGKRREERPIDDPFHQTRMAESLFFVSSFLLPDSLTQCTVQSEYSIHTHRLQKEEETRSSSISPLPNVHTVREKDIPLTTREKPLPSLQCMCDSETHTDLKERKILWYSLLYY